MRRHRPFGGHTGSEPGRGPYDVAWKHTGGNPLAAARVRARLTQQELADRLGLPRARIAQWESGARAFPHRDTEERQRLDAWMAEAGDERLPEDAAHRCKICDRELTDLESIIRGIGPECALK